MERTHDHSLDTARKLYLTITIKVPLIAPLQYSFSDFLCYMYEKGAILDTPPGMDITTSTKENYATEEYIFTQLVYKEEEQCRT